MKILRDLIVITLFAFMYMNCSNSKPRISHTNNTTSTFSHLDSLSCDSVLHLLVISSSVPAELKDKHVAEDGGNNDTLLVKISHENEAEPGAFVDAADGFLRIDMKYKKLFQVAREVDSLMEVECDPTILAHYISKCAHYIPSVP